MTEAATADLTRDCPQCAAAGYIFHKKIRQHTKKFCGTVFSLLHQPRIRNKEKTMPQTAISSTSDFIILIHIFIKSYTFYYFF